MHGIKKQKKYQNIPGERELMNPLNKQGPRDKGGLVIAVLYEIITMV